MIRLALGRIYLVLVVLLLRPMMAQKLPTEISVPHTTSPPLSNRAAHRLLEQATWGPTTLGSPVLVYKGFEPWFESQLTISSSTYTDQPLLNAEGNTNTNVGPTQIEFFQNGLSGPDQLRQRVAFALSEIWVVSETDLANASALPPILRLYQADAFTNYEQIMKDVTLSPAMGRYLNMVNNDKGSPTKGTSPNENYARELMQLFTLGLNELHPDGTPVLNSQGVSIPSYSQETVTALARALTGWTYAPKPGVATRAHNPTYYLSPMVAYEPNHDTAVKDLFPGYQLPAGQTAEKDLTAALHAVFLQPSLPPFVSQQLIQHLTTSSPSPEYVARVSAVFTDNGKGVRGDMSSIIHAILTDPEARAGDDPNVLPDPQFGHMREPVLFILNLLRGLNGTIATGSSAASRASALGQNPFYSPSVFNYFSPLYRTREGLAAPEFQIYSTQAATNRINLVNSAVYGGSFDANTKFDISAFTAVATNPADLIAAINTTFFHEALSDSLKAAMMQAMNAVSAPVDKAKAALYIALTSAEFQIIH